MSDQGQDLIKKVIAIQQPEHFPWLGFFHKMTLVDEYVYLDNVQFKKRYFENRNKIRTNSRAGFEWICIPVITKGRYTQTINKVEVDHTQNWRSKYLNKIYLVYKRARYFDARYETIECIINSKYDLLVEYNYAIINYVCSLFEIRKQFHVSSEILKDREKINGSDLILELCRYSDATSYVSGPAGRDYLESERFIKEGIGIAYHDYVHPQYRQMYEPFVPYMSSLDYIFNHQDKNVLL